MTRHAISPRFDAHAIHLARRIVANLNRMSQLRVAMEPSEEPLYDPAELPPSTSSPSLPT
jgi:hypothetical protein